MVVTNVVWWAWSSLSVQLKALLLQWALNTGKRESKTHRLKIGTDDVFGG